MQNKHKGKVLIMVLKGLCQFSHLIVAEDQNISCYHANWKCNE